VTFQLLFFHNFSWRHGNDDPPHPPLPLKNYRYKPKSRNKDKNFNNKRSKLGLQQRRHQAGAAATTA